MSAMVANLPWLPAMLANLTWLLTLRLALQSKESLAVFKPDKAACLLAERFNIIGWIYK